MTPAGQSGGPDRSDALLAQQRWVAASYTRLIGRMTRIAQRSLPASSLASAEDLVQQVFEEAWRTCSGDPSFLPGDGWLIQRLRSRILDSFRRSRRESRPAPVLALGSRTQSHEEVALANLTVEELIRHIPDPSDQLMLKLKMQGLTEREIAAIFNLRAEGRQVRDRLKRIRRQMSRSAVGE
jgi:RNA polymerase sigma factor (sigma-70 family)